MYAKFKRECTPETNRDLNYLKQHKSVGFLLFQSSFLVVLGLGESTLSGIVRLEELQHDHAHMLQLFIPIWVVQDDPKLPSDS